MFGFDSALPLRQTWDSNESSRTMADMLARGQQMRQQEMTMANMLRQQQQEQQLADIYRQNAQAPQALPQALMRGGFGPQALQSTEQLAEIQQRQAGTENTLSQIMQRGREQLGSLFWGTKDQADYERRLSTAPEQMRPMLPPTWEQAKPIVDAWAIPPEKRANLEHQTAQRKETERHNRASESIQRTRPSGMPALTIITGEGGAQYFVDPRKPNAPAVPVTDPQGNPVTKPQPTKAGRALNIGDRDKLEKTLGESSNLDSLIGRFQDSYAGKGAAGKTLVDVNKKLGSWASPGAQEEAHFWADFQGSFDLERRNKLFGASLTPGEAAAWEAAKTITPNSNPKVVRQALTRLRDAAASSLKRRGRSLAKDGYNAEAIEEYTGPLDQGEGQRSGEPTSARPNRVMRTDPKTGETRVWNGTAWVKE